MTNTTEPKPDEEPETLLGVVPPKTANLNDAVDLAISKGLMVKSVADDVFRVWKGSKALTPRLDLFELQAWLAKAE